MARPAWKPRPLWQLAVTTAGAAEEAVAALMERLFGPTPSVFVNAETQVRVLSLFLENRSACTAAQRQELWRGLARIRKLGLTTGPARIRLRRLPADDWAESWKRHFQPIEIGRALLIKPSWSRRQARKGQVLVTLDPGLSFGTGQHPTTVFCLRQLVACRRSGLDQSFLDIGVGSGILVIAAGKLGYRPADGFDVDPEAVRIAKANAQANQVHGLVDLKRQDLKRWPRRGRRYNVICANLTDDLLLTYARPILSRLRANGRLVLAGILRSRFEVVRRHYEAAGLRVVSSQTAGEWRSGAFAFQRSGCAPGDQPGRASRTDRQNRSRRTV
jgi:ribosomal protein L11 methyltransferase